METKPKTNGNEYGMPNSLNIYRLSLQAVFFVVSEIRFMQTGKSKRQGGTQ
jgi:hypothetical protein